MSRSEAWTRVIAESLGALIGVVLIPILAAPFAVLNSWVISVLWGWFLAPLGLPPIGCLRWIGITLVANRLLPPVILDDAMTEEQKKGAVKDRLSRGISYPLISLFLGWILHHWV